MSLNQVVEKLFSYLTNIIQIKDHDEKFADAISTSCKMLIHKEESTQKYQIKIDDIVIPEWVEAVKEFYKAQVEKPASKEVLKSIEAFNDYLSNIYLGDDGKAIITLSYVINRFCSDIDYGLYDYLITEVNPEALAEILRWANLRKNVTCILEN